MSQAKRLSGKTAIITGASGTIGAATASVFAEAGANVLLVARDESKLAAVAQTMPASQVSFVAADIATAQAAAQRINAQCQQCHVAVGISTQ